jgi:hypothetical protein
MISRKKSKVQGRAAQKDCFFQIEHQTRTGNGTKAATVCHCRPKERSELWFKSFQKLI